MKWAILLLTVAQLFDQLHGQLDETNCVARLLTCYGCSDLAQCTVNDWLNGPQCQTLAALTGCVDNAQLNPPCNGDGVWTSVLVTTAHDAFVQGKAACLLAAAKSDNIHSGECSADDTTNSTQCFTDLECEKDQKCCGDISTVEPYVTGGCLKAIQTIVPELGQMECLEGLVTSCVKAFLDAAPEDSVQASTDVEMCLQNSMDNTMYDDCFNITYVVDFLHWVVYGEKARREVQYCMPHLDTCLSGFNSVWFSDNINLDDLEAVCMNSGYADCIASESVCFMMGTQYMDAIDTVCQNVIADNCVIQALECVPGEFLSPANSFA
jgi:hypothetical protein